MGCAASHSLAGGGYNTFQQALDNNAVPHPSSLSFESLVSNYYVRLDYEGAGAARRNFVYPVFGAAFCRDPFQQDSGQRREGEYYLGVGLHTQFDGRKGFRSPLKCVIVLDTSGSMEFDLNQMLADSETRLQLALRVARHLLATLLRPGDHVAVVLAGQEPVTVLPLTPVADLVYHVPAGAAGRHAEVTDDLLNPFGERRVRGHGHSNLAEALRTAERILLAAAGGPAKQTAPLSSPTLGVAAPPAEARDEAAVLSQTSLRVFVCSDFRPSLGEAAAGGKANGRHEAVADPWVAPKHRAGPQQSEALTDAEAAQLIGAALNVVEQFPDSEAKMAQLVRVMVRLRGAARAELAKRASDRREGFVQVIARLAKPTRHVPEDADGADASADHAAAGVATGEPAAAPPIYTTLFPIGYDVDLAQLDQATQHFGCNSVSAAWSEAFFANLTEQFEYIVTPVARHLRVEVHSSPFHVQRVLGCDTSAQVVGSPNAADGEVLKVDALFPSPLSTELGIRGGVLLFKLARKKRDTAQWYQKPIRLALTYTDLYGETQTQYYAYRFPAPAAEPADPAKPGTPPEHNYFTSAGMRKAVQLARYADFINTAVAGRQRFDGSFQRRFDEFRAWFVGEMREVGDPELQREVDNWDKLKAITLENGTGGCSVM